jgi:hypothetical protein
MIGQRPSKRIGLSGLAAKIRAKDEKRRAHAEPWRKVRNACSACNVNVEMNFVCSISEGDEEGLGYQALYQCPKCKTVAVGP